jgi:hypothetical protein
VHPPIQLLDAHKIFFKIKKNNYTRGGFPLATLTQEQQCNVYHQPRGQDEENSQRTHHVAVAITPTALITL